MQKIFLSNIFNAVPLHEDRRGILSRQKVKVKEVLSLPNFTDAHKGKKNHQKMGNEQMKCSKNLFCGNKSSVISRLSYW